MVGGDVFRTKAGQPLAAEALALARTIAGEAIDSETFATTTPTGGDAGSRSRLAT
jgi:hypothetical protein